MGSHLLLAMNVLSLCADLAMNMREEKEIKLARNAKPDTSVSKVRYLYSYWSSGNWLNDWYAFFFLIFNVLILMKYLQVVHGLKVMKKKMTLMIWSMSLITATLMVWALNKLRRPCLPHASTLVVLLTQMDREFQLSQNWIHRPPALRFHFWPMARR